MAYDFYIGNMLLPVPPEKLTVKIKNGNKTYNMLNQGQINVLKSPDLTEIDFDVLLPNMKYPFAVYKNGFQRAEVYLEELERLKARKKTFQFIVSRSLPNGELLFDTNLTCSLENYTIKEDAGSNGMDVMVSISLKQYRKYGVKKCKVKTKKTLTFKKLRKTKLFNIKDGNYFYLVIKRDGDECVSLKLKKSITLYNLAKKVYGDGELYTVLQKANRLRKETCWKKSKKLKKGTNVLVPLNYWS